MYAIFFLIESSLHATEIYPDSFYGTEKSLIPACMSPDFSSVSFHIISVTFSINLYMKNSFARFPPLPWR